MPKGNRRADTGHADQIEGMSMAITIGEICKKGIVVLSSAFRGEEAAWKKLMLSMEPINRFNPLLNRYLSITVDMNS